MSWPWPHLIWQGHLFTLLEFQRGGSPVGSIWQGIVIKSFMFSWSWVHWLTMVLLLLSWIPNTHSIVKGLCSTPMLYVTITSVYALIYADRDIIHLLNWFFFLCFGSNCIIKLWVHIYPKKKKKIVGAYVIWFIRRIYCN